MRTRDFLKRLSHRLRGHGRPRHLGGNVYTVDYLCPCGAYLWKTLY